MISFLYLLSSTINYPLLLVGDNAIGIFDCTFSIALVYCLLFKRFLFTNDFVVFFFFVFILMLSVSLRFVNDTTISSIAYLFKLLQLSLIPITLSVFRVQSYDPMKILFFVLLITYGFVFYDLNVNSPGRARIPFLYNGSGPLGLLTMVYFYIGFVEESKPRKTALLVMGITLLFVSFSKSFIIALFALVLISLLLKFGFKIKKQILLITIITPTFTYIYLWFSDSIAKLHYLYDTILNLSEQTNFKQRVIYHWFMDFEQHVASSNLLWGHGVQHIKYSYDSLYFYSFYVFGVIGSVIFFAGTILIIRNSSREFKYYAVVLLSSGAFLETALISYRGLEPFILLMSFFGKVTAPKTNDVQK